LEINFTQDILILGNILDTIPTSAVFCDTSCSGSLQIVNNMMRDTNTSNGGAVDAITIAAASFTDILVQGNVRNGTNAIERGIENGCTTATLRGGGNAFNGNSSGAYTTTIGGLLNGYAAGNFICAANANTTVNNASVTAASVILLMPTNAAAGTLMSGATSLYTSARVAGTSFTLTTANAAAAAGTETFFYVILN
jgi:hypothetical protein